MSLLDNASLLITPNAYKEGKLYSVIPTNGNGDFTFTRATTATRINSAGLVELVPYNLVLQSQTFENASWFKFGNASGLAPVVTSNAGTAPDGTLTADRLQFNCVGTTSSDRSILSQSNITATIGSSYTISFYVKAFAPSEVGKQLRIALEQGGIASVITLTADYQRIVFTGVASATTLNFLVETRGTFTTNTTADVLLWGAQVNEGGLKDYQKTETRLNIPRLDYSLGGCPNILLEPQRTNLALRSQEFDNASWVKVNASVTANTTTSPDGTSNADSLVENTATNLHLTYQFFTSTATTYTYSCYIKPDTRTRAYLRTDTSAGTTRTLFDLTGAGSVVTLAHTSATITLVGNGWYRCTITFTEGTGAANRLFAVEGALGTSISYAGNGLTAFYLYGAQLEVGAYATSYIPTTSASVTRNNEICLKTGISSLIGQTEGTFFVDFNYFDLISAPSILEVVPLEIGNGTTGNRMYLSVYQDDIYIVIFTGGATQSLTNLGTLIKGRHKIGISYIANDVRCFVDGSFITSDTSVTLPPLSNIYVGSLSNATPQSHSINAVTLWKTRLTNAELEQLTTL